MLRSWTVEWLWGCPLDWQSGVYSTSRTAAETDLLEERETFWNCAPCSIPSISLCRCLHSQVLAARGVISSTELGLRENCETLNLPLMSLWFEENKWQEWDSQMNQGKSAKRNSQNVSSTFFSIIRFKNVLSCLKSVGDCHWFRRDSQSHRQRRSIGGGGCGPPFDRIGLCFHLLSCPSPSADNPTCSPSSTPFSSLWWPWEDQPWQWLRSDFWHGQIVPRLDWRLWSPTGWPTSLSLQRILALLPPHFRESLSTWFSQRRVLIGAFEAGLAAHQRGCRCH